MKQYVFISTFVAAGLCSLAFVPSASAQQFPTLSPDYANISYANASGSGCPAGTKTIYVTPDKKALSIVFDAFGAQAGPGVLPEEGRKFCQIVVMLDFPPGYSFSLFNATYRGYADLAFGVQGRQRSSYWFLGSPLSYAETAVSGFFTGNYDRTDEFEILAWSPCSGRRRPLNIKADVSVSNTNYPYNKGFMNVEGTELEIVYGLSWRRCP